MNANLESICKKEKIFLQINICNLYLKNKGIYSQIIENYIIYCFEYSYY